MMEMTSMGLLRNCLVEIDYQGNAIPELAKSWEASPDAQQWTFNIRKGVEFHNAKTLDAEDVIYSINLNRGEKSKSNMRIQLEIINEIRKVDKYTITFYLNSANVDFPYLMSSPLLPIVSKGTTNFGKGTGTGGYILHKFIPGERLFAIRNPNYWKEGRAHFDEVEIIVIQDTMARTNALETGQINLMNRVDLSSAPLLEKKSRIQLINVTGKGHYTMPMLTDRPPYENNNVRLALKYAIDRKELLKKILRGYGTLGNDQPISPSYRFYDYDLPQRNYDPEKAKFYMKKSGLDDYTFKLHAADAAFAGAVDAAMLYKESAAKAGIKIEVVKEPNDGYWSNVWMKKNWFLSAWRGRPTEDLMFSTAYAFKARWNESLWKNEKFNRLLNEARSELDYRKRRELYAELQRIVRDEGGSIIPLFLNIVDAASKKVKYRNIAKDRELDGLRAPERMWCPPPSC